MDYISKWLKSYRKRKACRRIRESCSALGLPPVALMSDEEIEQAVMGCGLLARISYITATEFNANMERAAKVFNEEGDTNARP